MSTIKKKCAAPYSVHFECQLNFIVFMFYHFEHFFFENCSNQYIYSKCPFVSNIVPPLCHEQKIGLHFQYPVLFIHFLNILCAVITWFKQWWSR